jgi:hypothetical protein
MANLLKAQSYLELSVPSNQGRDNLALFAKAAEIELHYTVGRAGRCFFSSGLAPSRILFTSFRWSSRRGSGIRGLTEVVRSGARLAQPDVVEPGLVLATVQQSTN